MINHTIGIVVPVYRVKREYLEVCLDSIVKQSYENIEIVLVDDASPDDCGIWCDELAKTDKRIKTVHHERNGGLPAARNTGVSSLSADWVIFVDADDWLEPNTCEALNQEINREKADIYVYSGFMDNKDKCVKCGYIYEDHRSFSSKEEREVFETRFLLDQTKIHVDNCFPVQSACCRMVAVDLFRTKGLQFEGIRFAEDSIFHLESTEVANKIIYIQQNFYHYRNTSGSMANSFRQDSDNEQLSFMKALWDFAYKNNKREKFKKQMYNISFISMQMCIWQKFFHAENKAGYFSRRRECKRFFQNEPYRSTLDNIAFDQLRTNQKIKYVLMKLSMYGTIVKLRNLTRVLKGETTQ